MSNDQRRPGVMESPIGRVNFTRNQPKVLTVDDSSDDFDNYIPEIPYNKKINVPPQELEYEGGKFELSDEEKLAQLQALKNTQRREKKQASEPARKVLEILTGIARLNDDVEVDGVTFSIRSLKSREMKEVIEESAKETLAASQAYMMRAHTLARSIWKIDNQPVELVIGSREVEDVLNVVNEMDEVLVNHLYDRYTKMIKLNNERFKDLGSNEKEVADTVKKS